MINQSTHFIVRLCCLCVQRLRREAGSQLVLLDNLTRRNRTLTRMFHGGMRARLLSSARECGRRWDDVNGSLEAITAHLQVLMFYGDAGGHRI